MDIRIDKEDKEEYLKDILPKYRNLKWNNMKELKLSFEEQDVTLKYSLSEEKIVIVRCAEVNVETHFDLYITFEEAEQLAKELLHFIGK